MWQKFPPRVRAASSPTLAGRHDVVGQAMAGPYAAGENDQARYARRLGVVKVLDWLEAQSGLTWQDRWARRGAGSAAGQDWRDTAERQLKDACEISASNRTVRSNLSLALELLICCDVIRPDLAWLLASATPAHWRPAWPASGIRTGSPRCKRSRTRRMPASPPPAGRCCRSRSSWASRAAWSAIITVGDCLELLEARAVLRGDKDNGGAYFYQCCTRRVSCRRSPAEGENALPASPRPAGPPGT